MLEKAEALLDLTYLREVTGGEEALVRELIALYIEETQMRWSALQEAVAKGAWESAWREAHTIKGSSSQLGGGVLSDAASELEGVLRQREEGDLKGAMDAFGRVFIELVSLFEGAD